MTEAEWLACDDPIPLLRHLRPKTGARKRRLYLCGGCRRIGDLFFDPKALDLVDVAERYADGRAGEWELYAAN